MEQISSSLLRRLFVAVSAAGLTLAAAPAFAGVELLLQDRDVARSVSLGGSCNRCELSGRNLTGATFTSIVQLKAHIDAFIEAYNDDAEPFVWT